MNADVKAQWVAALRSGDYQQTQGKLGRVEAVDDGEVSFPVGFCCLGVLCDLAVKEGVISGPTELEGVLRYPDGVWSESSILPADVMRWAGLDGRNPDVRTAEDGELGLASVNDAGSTFDQIAALIEEQL